MTDTSSPQRILVIKLADLGDVLLCEPSFRSLRLAFPSARIDVLTTPGAVELLTLIGHDLRPVTFQKNLFDNPATLLHPRSLAYAASLAIRLRLARYDRVGVLHHLTTPFGARKFAALVKSTGSSCVEGLDNGRGTFLTHPVVDLGFGERHEATYMRDVAVAAGGVVVDPVPAITIEPSSLDLQDIPNHFAAIFPATGSYSRAREWPTDRYAELAARLLHRGLTPVIVGAHDARPAANRIRSVTPAAIDLTGRTSLQQLAVVLKRASIVIGGDSFIGHLAAAVETPTLSIFGPSNSAAWAPVPRTGGTDGKDRANRGAVVRSGLPCEPCIYTGFRLGRPHGCPDRTCLKLITVDDVDHAIANVVGVAP